MTVDLRTGIQRPHNPLDYITKIAAVAPAPPQTPHPLWTAFLLRVTARNNDIIGFLKRYLGYSLTGHMSFAISVGCRSLSVAISSSMGATTA